MTTSLSRIEMFPERSVSAVDWGPVLEASGNPHAAGLAQAGRIAGTVAEALARGVSDGPVGAGVGEAGGVMVLCDEARAAWVLAARAADELAGE